MRRRPIALNLLAAACEDLYPLGRMEGQPRDPGRPRSLKRRVALDWLRRAVISAVSVELRGESSKEPMPSAADLAKWN